MQPLCRNVIKTLWHFSKRRVDSLSITAMLKKSDFLGWNESMAYVVWAPQWRALAAVQVIYMTVTYITWGGWVYAAIQSQKAVSDYL